MCLINRIPHSRSIGMIFYFCHGLGNISIPGLSIGKERNAWAAISPCLIFDFNSLHDGCRMILYRENVHVRQTNFVQNPLIHLSWVSAAIFQPFHDPHNRLKVAFLHFFSLLLHSLKIIRKFATDNFYRNLK